ncbi:transcriptional regulator, partial [Microbacterium sp. SUBG005]
GNQQQYMSRLVNKLRSDEVLSNPGTLIGLANTAVNNIQPSESLADPLRIAQLAYTLKDVPFSDITFVQYPVVDDPYDSNRVAPDEASAQVLFEALAANAPLTITGEAGRGVVADPSAPPRSPPPRPRRPLLRSATDVTASPDASAAPGVVDLPENINGTKADQATCSAGNG